MTISKLARQSMRTLLPIVGLVVLCVTLFNCNASQPAPMSQPSQIGDAPR